MAAVEEITMLSQVSSILEENGLEGIASCVEILINEAMRIERSRELHAEPYQRTQGRRGYANGYKPKTIRSRIGALSLNVPQVRGGIDFYPSALERGVRSERALKLAVAEMYINGVSTRRVTKVVEELCGLSVSSAEVSRATELLDEELEKWRNRPLGCVAHLVVDARYEKVRVDGTVRSVAVLIASGILPDGHRSILGTSVALSEAEVHWREFFKSLQARGLHGVKTVTSDSHEGLQKALKAVMPGIVWQRCQVHLQRNAQALVPKVDMKDEVASDIRSIFNAPNALEAQRLLGMTVKKYSKKASRLSIWMEENIPDGLAIFSQPKNIWIKLRTTNGVERINRDILRRTKVAGLFPNSDSLLRICSAILMEISEEWETGKTFIKLS